MDEKLLSSPDVNLMNSLSSEWYQTVMQDSFDLQMKLAVQMERRLRASSSVDSFQTQLPAEAEDEEEEIYSFSPSSPFIPTGSLVDISSSSSTKNNFDSDRPIRGRRYKTDNILAQVCARFLQKTANPRPHDLNEIVAQIVRAEDGILQYSEKKLKSQVREWFRKRREYMATKIYRSCDRLLPKALADEEAWIVARQVCNNETVIGLIAVEAKLPMSSEEEKFGFVREKVKDYYMSYPKRRLRNGLIARKEASLMVSAVKIDDDSNDKNGEDSVLDDLIIWRLIIALWFPK